MMVIFTVPKSSFKRYIFSRNVCDMDDLGPSRTPHTRQGNGSTSECQAKDRIINNNDWLGNSPSNVRRHLFLEQIRWSLYDQILLRCLDSPPGRLLHQWCSPTSCQGYPTWPHPAHPRNKGIRSRLSLLISGVPSWMWRGENFGPIIWYRWQHGCQSVDRKGLGILCATLLASA